MLMPGLGAVGGKQTNSLSSQTERSTQRWAGAGTDFLQRHLHVARTTLASAGACYVHDVLRTLEDFLEANRLLSSL